MEGDTYLSPVECVTRLNNFSRYGIRILGRESDISKKVFYIGFEALTAVVVKIHIFWI
jgi:hypothetical protein